MIDVCIIKKKKFYMFHRKNIFKVFLFKKSFCEEQIIQFYYS